MDKSIIIGAGKTTDSLIRYIKELGYKFSDCFYICLDNDHTLWGTDFNGVRIDAVEKVLDYPDIEIVISSIYVKDIRRQLERLKVNGRIVTSEDYKRKLMVDYQIRNYNVAHSRTLSKKRTHIKELTVYTVIFGGYDFLQEVINVDSNVNYICFTDDASLHSDTWKIYYVDRMFDNPVMESRKYKIMPQLFIDTEYSLYIDANIRLDKSPLEYMEQYLTEGSMVLIPHPKRDCIYQETAACIMGKKDSARRLIHQAYEYSECGCPEHSGLYWGGMIGRRHFEKEMILFDEEWWWHFQKYSRRDQISLGYLIWKHNSLLSLADIDYYNSIWITTDGEHRIEKAKLV